MVASQTPHEHDWVQADEHDRRERVAPEQLGAAPDEIERGQAGERKQPLQRPERRGDPERDEGEGQQREQRTVRAQQLVPVAEVVARVAVRLEDRDRCVGIEVVHHLHAAVIDVVEDVRQRERHRQQEERVNRRDRSEDPPRSQLPRVVQREQVARVHGHQRAREEVLQRRRVARQAWPEASQRPCHPMGKVARVRGRREHARPVGRCEDDERATRDEQHQRHGSQPRLALGARDRAGARKKHASPAHAAAHGGRVAQGKCSRVAGHAEGPPKRAPEG